MQLLLPRNCATVIKAQFWGRMDGQTKDRFHFNIIQDTWIFIIFRSESSLLSPVIRFLGRRTINNVLEILAHATSATHKKLTSWVQASPWYSRVFLLLATATTLFPFVIWGAYWLQISNASINRKTNRFTTVPEPLMNNVRLEVYKRRCKRSGLKTESPRSYLEYRALQTDRCITVIWVIWIIWVQFGTQVQFWVTAQASSVPLCGSPLQNARQFECRSWVSLSITYRWQRLNFIYLWIRY